MKSKRLLLSTAMLIISLIALLLTGIGSSINILHEGKAEAKAENSLGAVTVKFAMTYKGTNGIEITNNLSFASADNNDKSRNCFAFVGQKLSAPTEITVGGVSSKTEDYLYAYAKNIATTTFSENPPIFVENYILRVTSKTDPKKITDIFFSIKNNTDKYYYIEFDYSLSHGYDDGRQTYLYWFTKFSVAPSVKLFTQDGIRANIAAPSVSYYTQSDTISDPPSNKSTAPTDITNGKMKYYMMASSSGDTNYYGKSENYEIIQTIIDFSKSGIEILITNGTEKINESLFESFDSSTLDLSFIGDNYSAVYFRITTKNEKTGKDIKTIVSSSLYDIQFTDNNGSQIQGPYAKGEYKVKTTINDIGKLPSMDIKQLVFKNDENTIDSMEFTFNIVGGASLRPQFEFKDAAINGLGYYDYIFDGNGHMPTVSFIDSNGVFQYPTSDKYKISFKSITSTGWNTDPSKWSDYNIAPIYVSDEVYCMVVENAGENTLLYNTKFYSPAFIIINDNNAFSIEVSSALEYMLNPLPDGTLVYKYSGKELPLNFVYKNASGAEITEKKPNPKGTIFYKVSTFINQYEYSGLTPLDGKPIEEGYYFAEQTFSDGGTRKTKVFKIEKSDNNISNILLYVEYKNEIRYKTSDSLNLKLKKSNGQEIIMDSNDLTIKYYNNNNLITTEMPTDVGEYTFTVTLPNSVNYAFFAGFDTNNIATKKESDKYTFKIKKQILKANVISISDKEYDATSTAKVILESKDGRLVLSGIDAGDDVFVDMAKVESNYIVSKTDKTPIATVKLNLDIPIKRDVFVNIKLEGADAGKYVIEDLFLESIINPKKVYIKGENVELSYHETANPKIKFGLFQDSEFQNTWQVYEDDRNKVVQSGAPTFQNVSGVGEFEIYYSTLKLTGEASANYQLVVPQNVKFLLIVKKTQVLVTVDQITKVYGNPDKIKNGKYLDIKFSIDSGLTVSGYTLNDVLLTRTVGETVGKYNLSIDKIILSKSTTSGGSKTEEPIDPNYPLEYANYSFKLKDNSIYEIAQRELTFVVEDIIKPYGYKVTDKSYVIKDKSGLKNSPTLGQDTIKDTEIAFTIGDDPNTFTSAGKYTIQLVKNKTIVRDAQSNADVSANYKYIFAGAKCEILQRKISIAIADPENMLTKIYGAPDPVILGVQIGKTELDSTKPNYGYGLLKEHTMTYIIYRDTNVEDYQYVADYSLLRDKYKFTVVDASGTNLEKNYIATFEDVDKLKFRITKRDLMVSLKKVSFEYSSAASDEEAYDYLRLTEIKNFAVYEDAFQLKDNSINDIPEIHRPKFKFPAYKDLKEGINIITIDCSVAAQNYRFIAQKNGELNVQYKNNIQSVSLPIIGDQITGYKTFVADNKIWKSSVMYIVNTKSGQPPDEGRSVQITLIIPETMAAEDFVLYYVSKSGEKAVKVEEFTINAANEKTKEPATVTFATKAFGHYIIAEDTGRMKIVAIGSLVGSVVLIALIVLTIVLILKKKAKDLASHAEVAFVKEELLPGDDNGDGGDGEKSEEDVSDLLKDSEAAESMDEPNIMLGMEPDVAIVQSDEVESTETKENEKKKKSFKKSKQEAKTDPENLENSEKIYKAPVETEEVLSEPFVDPNNNSFIDFSGDFSQFTESDNTSVEVSPATEPLAVEPAVQQNIEPELVDFGSFSDSRTEEIEPEAKVIEPEAKNIEPETKVSESEVESEFDYEPKNEEVSEQIVDAPIEKEEQPMDASMLSKDSEFDISEDVISAPDSVRETDEDDNGDAPTDRKSRRANKKKAKNKAESEPISAKVAPRAEENVADTSDSEDADDNDPTKKERRPRTDIDIENEDELKKFLESLDL